MIMDKERLTTAGIDIDGALERFAGNEAIYEKYLFRFQTDPHMAAVKEAMADNDYNKVLEQAHAMKGMTGTLGMDDLYQSCSDVVQAIRNEKTDTLPELVDKMESSYQKVMSIYQ